MLRPLTKNFSGLQSLDRRFDNRFLDSSGGFIKYSLDSFGGFIKYSLNSSGGFINYSLNSFGSFISYSLDSRFGDGFFEFLNNLVNFVSNFFCF